MMNRQQTNLFISDTSCGGDFLILPETQKYYGHIIVRTLQRELKTQQDFEILGRRLIAICQYAHAARQINVLREVSDFLVSLPLRNELRTIGVYYQAQVLHRTGEFKAARIVFEQLATHPQFLWKPRAIASAGSCYFDCGDIDTAAAFYLDALSATRNSDIDLVTWLKSQWMIGAIWSIQGDHNCALTSLESLYPLVCHVSKTHAATYYDYLNSLAVRLMNLNRLDEAEHLSKITLASPAANNTSAYYETRDEIREKRKAVAATVFVNVDSSAVQEQKNREYSINREPEKRLVTFSLITTRADGVSVIAVRFVRAKAAVAASSDGGSKPFFSSIKLRAPPALNRQSH